MDSNQLHQALLDPAAYPEGSAPVTWRETHISRLYFVGERVYKVKKPVNFGFLDFSGREQRLFYCQEEVRLNQRFAPDTYLGVKDIRQQDGQVTIDGSGVLLDHCVVMRRLPAERMLAHLLDQGADELPAAMERLGRRLGALHRDAEICRGQGDTAQAQILRRNWQENFQQVEPLCGPTVGRTALGLMHVAVERQLIHHADLLAEREARGLVRDGHGDLHAEHICLTEPLRIYDCIEFNRRFRVGDILGDLAFLLMDLDFRGRHDLALRLQEAWSAELPAAGGPAELLRFFQLYRAFVRGKVDTFLATDPNAADETREQAAIQARRYFNLGLGYLAPPVLILCCGLMGVGKSAVANPLATALNATLLRSDVVRKSLAGHPAKQPATPFGSGLYTPHYNDLTYQALYSRAEEVFQTGRALVIDAAFGRHSERQRFVKLATAWGWHCQLLYLHCPPEIAKQRLRQRQALGFDPSDGRDDLYPAQAAVFEYPAADEAPLLLDTTAPIDLNVQRILATILQQPSATAQ